MKEMLYRGLCVSHGPGDFVRLYLTLISIRPSNLIYAPMSPLWRYHSPWNLMYRATHIVQVADVLPLFTYIYFKPQSKPSSKFVPRTPHFILAWMHIYWMEQKTSHLVKIPSWYPCSSNDRQFNVNDEPFYLCCVMFNVHTCCTVYIRVTYYSLHFANDDV